MKTSTSSFVLAGALAALFSIASQAGQLYRPTSDSDNGVGLTRAEVIADTNLWVRAGVNQFNLQSRYHGDRTAYDRALAEYHRLRHSQAYAEEVARVEAERGEAPSNQLSRE